MCTLSDAKQLIGMAKVRVYNCLHVSVCDPHSEGNFDIHRLRNTGNTGWRKGPPRRDTVWIASAAQHKNLNHRVPAYLDIVFRIYYEWLPKHYLDVVYVQPFNHNGGKFERATELIVVTDEPRCPRVILPLQDVLGACHLLRIGSKMVGTPPEEVTDYYVNSRIDVNTYNTIGVTTEKGNRPVRGDE